MTVALGTGAPGILLVDKPQGITSHDVVSRARKVMGTRKIGHAGTLDPMATGLLILGVNTATRLLTYVVGLDKEYVATIRLGAGSTTDDAEGELGAFTDPGSVTDGRLADETARLTGPIRQRPSSVSAIKVDGKRAYALARAGEAVVLPERPVTVHAFEILQVRRGQWLDVDVRVECSTGTYIRALARDLGQSLGVGGHLTALRRTRIGPFAVTDAVPPDESLRDHLHGSADVASLLHSRLDLSAQEAIDLAHGKRIPVAGTGTRAAVAPDGRLVGLIDIIDSRAHVIVNFPEDRSP